MLGAFVVFSVSIETDWQYSETSQLRSPSALGLCDVNSNVTATFHFTVIAMIFHCAR